MRRAVTLLVSIVVLVGSSALAGGAQAASPAERLDQARQDQREARAALAEAKTKLDSALAEYARVQGRLDQAAVDVVGSYVEQDRLDGALAVAQQQLNNGAAAAYEAGPALTLDLFLGSGSTSDFVSAKEYMARAIGLSQDTVDRVTQGRAALQAAQIRRHAQQRALADDVDRLNLLAAESGDALGAAQEAATAAGAKVTVIQKEVDALAAAQAAITASLGRVVDPGRGLDQTALLALLGPSGGKTCETPAGLGETGEHLAGQSSWYGWDFAGQHTASGAIFDPQLFTVANKELPMNVFVKLHYQGRCAIALVNDRGPYGVAGRIFDASEAVAEYLGFKGAGVGYVTADVLIATP